MVKTSVDVDGKPMPCVLQLDGYHKEILDDANKLQNLDWDVIGFYIGYEGDGKTTKCMEDCLYMDYKFDLSKVVFNARQFDEVVDNCEDGASIQWDESDELGSNWMSEMLIAIKRKFKRIRKKRLYIGLVTPTVFDLNKYFVIHRTRFLIHIYAEGLKRGYFRFFNRDAKKKLYLKGKRDWDMNAAKPVFRGSFTKLPAGFPIDMDEYERKKDLAMAESDDVHPKSIPDAIAKKRREYLVNISRWSESHGVKFNDADLAYWFGCDRSLISRDYRGLSKEWELGGGKDKESTREMIDVKSERVGR